MPRGFVDRSPEDIRATDEMVAKIREVFERYGFDPVETPMFEYTDCLGKFLPDSDRPNEGVFSVEDDDEQWMSLRYDLTAPLARHVAENINEIQLPYRTYRNGWVFRNEGKIKAGRFRQFKQFDADTVGAPGVQADAEMCMMMADVMEALGIKRGGYVIRVNNRKVLDGVMEALMVQESSKIIVLRSVDKLEKVGPLGLTELLDEGRTDDESGDFTQGAKLEPSANVAIVSATTMISPWMLEKHSRLQRVHRFFTRGWRKPFSIRVYEKYLRKMLNSEDIPLTTQIGLDELENLRKLVRAAGYGTDQIRIDPSCVRGLEYYTGMVYEAELTFPVTNEKGQEVVFGSVGGGGRYDGLVKRFTGQDVPATGFSMGVSRLMTALKNLGKLGQDQLPSPVLVTVMDKDVEALGSYQKMVQDLRKAGIRAEMYQGNLNKFGKQLQYGDRRGCPIAIIQGQDERANGKLQIKDLIEGRKQAEAIESNEEWRETRPGQFEINQDDLVAEVTKLLAEQGSEG